MEETVLITGGAGYIASHVIVELLENNYTVIALDNLRHYYSVNQSEKPECIKRIEQLTGKVVPFYKADISDQSALRNIFKLHKIDVVIHMAALTDVSESIKTPLTYYSNNVVSSITLFEVMKDFNIKKLIFSSSSNVFGTPQVLPVSEDHLTGIRCTNPYGRSKFFVEEILRNVCESDENWQVVVLRYFNPAGAHKSGLIGQNPFGVPNNLIPCIMQVAEGQKERVTVYGSDYDTKDGTCSKDFTHITDIATGHVKALEKLKKLCAENWVAYNLGTGQGYTILEVIEVFSKTINRKIPYEIVNRRKGDLGNIFADITKAKRELNWMPTKTIVDICTDAWKWHSQNRKSNK
ncbi:hypothetical protein RI129_002329 [Pyrocoelia pectoralis]|uniref:UDP-glucose 4-epimerase n=1 Tax=Pyrocoelia pectoralis TaxID=417401 RepID=A0AAN7ZM12_9COLE